MVNSYGRPFVDDAWRAAIPGGAGVQFQRIDPPRWVGYVSVRVDPTGQLHRVRCQVTTNIRIVVAMAVVVQPAFGVEVLALEA